MKVTVCRAFVLVVVVLFPGPAGAQDDWWTGIWGTPRPDPDNEDYNNDYKYDYTDSDSDLSGPHVCSRRVFESGYVLQNVTYTCWKRSTFACSSGRCEGDSCRRRNRKTCRVQTRSTCYRMEQRCVQDWVTKKYCCPGYEEDGQGGCGVSIQCSDEDNGGCDQVCRSDGSTGHRCQCFDGYSLKRKTQCVDVDECDRNNGGCKHKCDNTLGSYFCSCENGYRLELMHECAEIDECEYGNGGCEHNCVNKPGTYYCTCNHGYRLVNGSACEDVDECATLGLNGGCEVECVNFPGGFRCVCDEGYQLAPNNKTCKAPGDEATGGPKVDLLGQEESSSAGVVAGGTIAGILVLVGLLLLLLFLLIRRKRRKAESNDTDTIGSVSATVPLRGANEYQSTNGYKPKPPIAYANLGYSSKNSIIKHSEPSAPIKELTEEPPAYEDGYSMPEGEYSMPGGGEENIYDDVVVRPIPPPPYSEKPQSKSHMPQTNPPPAPTPDQLKSNLSKLRKTGKKDDH